MLRITTCNDPENTRFVVEGRLAGACVGELENCWRAARSLKSERAILVDLAGVTFVDQSGKELLKRMHELGVGFLAPRLMTKCLIEEISGHECLSETQPDALPTNGDLR